MASENKASMFNFSKTKKNPKNYIFMIEKDWNFCDQILQYVAILDKKLKFSTSTFHSVVAFQLSNLLFLKKNI